MSGRRIGAIALRIVSQFRRDRRTLALLFVVPVIVLVLVGYLLRTTSGSLTIYLVVDTNGAPPQAFSAFRSAVEQERVTVREASKEEAIAALRRGEGAAAIVFTGNRPTDLRAEVILEGTNPNSNQAVIQIVNQAVNLGPGLSVVGSPATDRVQTTYIYGGPEYEFIDYESPPLIGFFAFFFVFLLTAVSFLRERTFGTLERLLVTPTGRAEIVLGYMIGFGIFALLQSAVVLLISIFGLRIHYAGNPLLVFVVVALLTIGSVNLGIFLSTFAGTELQAVQFIPIVIVPQGMLSGIFWPIDALPDWLQIVARALPLTYSNEALRDIMLRGFPLRDPNVLIPIAALAAFAAFFAALASLTLRRQTG